MKRTVLIATGLFWVGIAGFIAFGTAWEAPDQQKNTGKPASPPPAQTPVETIYSFAEVEKHGSAESCWMIIEGKVYDVTRYVDRHPSRPQVLLKYCGKEATQGFNTKDRGRPHSARARRLLEEFTIGKVSGRAD
jgi:hypothetical protein